MRHPSPHHRPAAVLLLSLLIMSAITASSITIAILITSDFLQTRTTAQYSASTFAADSGIERGLAVIAAGRAASTLSATMAAAQSSDASPILLDAGSTKATVNAQAGVQQPAITIPAGATYTFDLLTNDATLQKPKKLFLSTPAVAGGTLSVEWSVISGQGSAGQGRTGPISLSAALVREIPLLDVYSEGSNAPLPFAGGTYLGFRIKMTAGATATIPNIAIYPCDSTATSYIPSPLSCDPTTASMPLYSTIQLTANGTSGEASTEKQVTALWQRPSSGAFAFVLFTEGNIKPF